MHEEVVGLATVVLATLFPVTGDAEFWLGKAAKYAVMLLFFLHGLKLPRENLLAAVQKPTIVAAIFSSITPLWTSRSMSMVNVCIP